MTQPINTFYVIQNTSCDLYYNKSGAIASVGGSNTQWSQNEDPCASIMQATKFRQKRTAQVHLKMLQEKFENQPEVTDHLVIVPVTGNSEDFQCEFRSSGGKKLPSFTKPKRETHCQMCGLKIPAFIPYFGGNYKTTVCIICMHEVVKEAESLYEEYREKHPTHLVNYEHAKLVNDL